MYGESEGFLAVNEDQLMELLAAGYDICQASAVDNAGTLMSLFLAGLAGSGAHCIGMCGPIVLSQVTARLEDIPASSMGELNRLSGAALVPYQFGRMTTYAILGGIGASLSGGIIALSGLRFLTGVLLCFAGLFFIAYAGRTLDLTVPGFATTGGESKASALLGRSIRPLFQKPVGWRGYLLGVALGFIPCGLLYGALAAASSTADPIAGIFGMMAFALGTVPALFVVGITGHVAAGRWKVWMIWVAPVLLLVNGGFLLIMAWQMMI